VWRTLLSGERRRDAVREACEVVLGLERVGPELGDVADPRLRPARPVVGCIDVTDGLLGHGALLARGAEDLGAVLRTDDVGVEVGPVDLKNTSSSPR
jgi:hypothetical protein